MTHWDQERHEREERLWTQSLLASCRDVTCEGCKTEIVRTGGVVGTCDECRFSRGRSR